MGKRIQKVKRYESVVGAEYEMNKHIRDGWFVHACSVTSLMAGHSPFFDVLVVYEKEEQDGH